MSPPIHEPKATGGGESGSLAPPLLEEIRRRRHQAVLEEPEPVADLVRDAQPVVPHLVRLPEQRHLLGDPLLRLELLDGGDARVVELAQLRRDANVAEQNRAPRRFRWVCGQHEPDLRAVRALVEVIAELQERALERLARDATVVRVLAAAAQPVMLLGEVRELEVEAERAQDECLLARAERRVDGGDRAVAAGRARVATDLLDELEEPRSFLLDEHGAEDRPQHAHVAAQRRSGVGHAPTGYECRPRAVRTASASGSIVVTRDVPSWTDGRAPVTTSTTRDPGAMWPRRIASTSAPRAAPPEKSGATPVLSESSAVCFDDLVLGDRDDRAARRARRAEREIAVRRVADRERRRRASMPRRARSGGRLRTRRRSGSSRVPGRRTCRGTGSAARPARVTSAKPCASFEKQRAARRRADDRVGQLPVELLRDLERDRLRALAGVRVEVAADEAPREEQAELELEAAAVVVGAVDGEDARARVAGRNGGGLAADRREHDRLEPGRSGGSRDGVAEVAGRGAAERRHAVIERRRRGDRRDAVLVRLRRVLTLELQMKIDAERVGERGRSGRAVSSRRRSRPAAPAGSRSW